MTKKKAFTCTSASLLLLPLIHAVLFAVFMGLACLLEIPCNRDGIYTVVTIIGILLMLTFPLTVIFNAPASIGLSIWALCRGESKIKNIAIIVVWMILTALTVWSTISFWYGTMGV